MAGGYGPYSRFHAEANLIPALVKPSLPSWPTDCLSSAIIPALEEAYNSAPDRTRIKAVITSNPNNPIMKCWPKDVVRQMMDFCQQRNLHYISDEVFANTVFDPDAEQFVSALSLLKNPDKDDSDEGKSIIEPSMVHVVWSTTKDFGACGVRSVCFFEKPDHEIIFLINLRAVSFHIILWFVPEFHSLLRGRFLLSPLISHLPYSHHHLRPLFCLQCAPS
jgi:hypothetical protein